MANHVNEIETIFRYFLGFLSPKGLNILLNSRYSSDNLEFLYTAQKLLGYSASNLERWISLPGDEEDIVMFLNIYLWKERHGQIAKRINLNYSFEVFFHQLIIHREMINNKYANIDKIEFGDCRGNFTNYCQEFNECLSCYESSEKDDLFSYFFSILNVYGCNVKTHPRLNEINKLVVYTLENLHIDSRLQWVQPANFAVLMYDLNWNPEDTWSAYCYLVRNGCRSINDFVAALLGFKMYGSQTKDLWSSLNPFGNIDLIELLADS